MRAEDAEELLNVFMREFYRIDAGMLDTIRHCIAAVYPLIAKAERERCAKVAEMQFAHWSNMTGTVPPSVVVAAGEDIAAAIRALGDGEEET